MAKVLIICEKPAVARETAIALLKSARKGVNFVEGDGIDGNNITICWARGHLMELARPESYDAKYKGWNVEDLPIVPVMPWKFKQEVKTGVTDLFATIRTKVKEHSGAEIVNACDAEREGELIFRKLLDNIPTAKATVFSRVWTSKMTSSEIQAAYKSRLPLAKYDGYSRSGYTRDEADWFIGMNLTVLATKTLPRGAGDWKLWSVGRVQTPTLAMIVDRDASIKSFVPQTYWEVFGEFDAGRGKSDLDAYAAGAKRLELLGKPAKGEDKKVFWEKAKADAYAASAKATTKYDVRDEKTRTSSKPPVAFNLLDIQKHCSTKYGMTGAVTLKLVQDLYEQKLVSYPRTDSRYYNESQKDDLYRDLGKVLDYVKTKFPSMHISTQALMPKTIADAAVVYNDKKVGDHYALCPTGEVKGIDALDNQLLNVFIAIVTATLKALDEKAEYDQVSREWKQHSPGLAPYSPTEFKTSRKTLAFAGWTRWEKDTSKDVETIDPLKGSIDTLKSIEIKEGKTTPPKHYDDGSILSAMEYAGRDGFDDITDETTLEALMEVLKDKGLGTPATRTNIIETLVTRGYLFREKSWIKATANGELLITELRKLAPNYTSAQQTAEWELDLQKMKRGDPTAPTREKFLDALLAQFEKEKGGFLAVRAASIAKTVIPGVVCPRSGGDVYDCGKYFAFSGFPKLRLYKEVLGKTFSATDYSKVLDAALKGTKLFHTLTSKAGKPFEAHFNLEADEARLELEMKPRAPGGAPAGEGKVLAIKCPKSGKEVKDHGTFIIFSGFPTIRIYKQMFGKTFTEKEIFELVKSNVAGQPMEWNLYSEKSKKSYKAKIVIDEPEKKLKLAF